MGDKSTKTSSRVRLAKPYRQAAVGWLGDVQDLYGQYQGMDLPSTYVGISPERQQALGQVQDIAGRGEVIGTSLPEWQRIAGGQYLDPTTNPYYERMASAAAAPVAAGLAGSGRLASGIGSGMLANARANVGAQLYGQEVQRQMQALGMTPQMQAAQYDPAVKLGMVGEQLEADERAQRAEEMRQFQWPWMLSQMYGEQLRANPLAGESDATAKTVQPFDWGGFLGTAALMQLQGTMDMASSAAGGAGGMAMMCWAASVFYDWGSAPWQAARRWIVEGWQGPEADFFRVLYARYGREWAARLERGELEPEKARAFFAWARERGEAMA